jgi:hypothetical protein
MPAFGRDISLPWKGDRQLVAMLFAVGFVAVMRREIALLVDMALKEHETTDVAEHCVMLSSSHAGENRPVRQYEGKDRQGTLSPVHSH